MAEEQAVDDTSLSIQDRLFPELPCFGCGPNNPKGLRLRSYLLDGEVRARFTPWPEHDNGLGYLNGGIIATVLDCHSAAAALWEAHQRGWTPLPGAALSHVTAGLDVHFLRPKPFDGGRRPACRRDLGQRRRDHLFGRACLERQSPRHRDRPGEPVATPLRSVVSSGHEAKEDPHAAADHHDQ